jgi:hypothetical protein
VGFLKNKVENETNTFYVVKFILLPKFLIRNCVKKISLILFELF